MLPDLTDQRTAVTLGHGVLGLDFLLGVDAFLERGEDLLRLLAASIRADQSLSVHARASLGLKRIICYKHISRKHLL